jgi:hypothetical protein
MVYLDIPGIAWAVGSRKYMDIDKHEYREITSRLPLRSLQLTVLKPILIWSGILSYGKHISSTVYLGSQVVYIGWFIDNGCRAYQICTCCILLKAIVSNIIYHLP